MRRSRRRRALPERDGPGTERTARGRHARLSRFRSFEGPRDRGEFEPFLRRLALLVALIVAIQVAGAIAYSLTEDVSLWRGFLFTLDTVATVGSAPEPPDLAGQIVKVLLIMLGVGTLFYALVTVTEFFVAGHLGEILEERRTLKNIDDLTGHHLICGFGRVGRQAAKDLQAGGVDFVVIDELEENKELADQRGAPFLLGRPSDDEMLKAAGIARAISVLACVDSDAENIFICLTARELRSDITVVARASVEDSEKKLLRAGADRVISPYKSSGAEMARLALQPQVTGVVDVAPEYRMEEIDVSEGCEAAGKTIGEVRGNNTIPAVRSSDGKVHAQPPEDTVLHPGDVVVAMGTVEDLRGLEPLFIPRRTKTAGTVLGDLG
ncbi:MAG TPA: TrkA family potassium uptake protein [Solirubrobacterales bacterium]|nr:TrkA family potassium uptake protein [Solirubrobacterales bacterium]